MHLYSRKCHHRNTISVDLDQFRLNKKRVKMKVTPVKRTIIWSHFTQPGVRRVDQLHTHQLLYLHISREENKADDKCYRRRRRIDRHRPEHNVAPIGFSEMSMLNFQRTSSQPTKQLRAVVPETDHGHHHHHHHMGFLKWPKQQRHHEDHYSQNK